MEKLVNMVRSVKERGRVKDAIVPFVLLYQEMVNNKIIDPIESLPGKEKYYDETIKDKARRDWTAKALYLYDILNE